MGEPRHSRPDPVGVGTMTFINPLSGALVPGTAVQRAATDKERQIARSQALRKNAAAEGDHVEHQVESTEELTPASGEDPSGGRGDGQPPRDRKPQDANDDHPHIDVKA